MIKHFLLAFLFMSAFTSPAQHLFKEHFEGCNTDQFGLENDSTDIDIEHNEVTKVVLDSLSAKELKKISGKLLMQVIVDTDGTPCLISVENTTNVTTARLGLKNNIDKKLTCSKPKSKTAAIIMVSFKNGIVEIVRLGYDGNKGMHVLVE